eukprot:s606_g3.t1
MTVGGPKRMPDESSLNRYLAVLRGARAFGSGAVHGTWQRWNQSFKDKYIVPSRRSLALQSQQLSGAEIFYGYDKQPEGINSMFVGELSICPSFRGFPGTFERGNQTGSPFAFGSPCSPIFTRAWALEASREVILTAGEAENSIDESQDSPSMLRTVVSL